MRRFLHALPLSYFSQKSMSEPCQGDLLLLHASSPGKRFHFVKRGVNLPGILAPPKKAQMFREPLARFCAAIRRQSDHDRDPPHTGRGRVCQKFVEVRKNMFAKKICQVFKNRDFSKKKSRLEEARIEMPLLPSRERGQPYDPGLSEPPHAIPPGEGGNICQNKTIKF